MEAWEIAQPNYQLLGVKDVAVYMESWDVSLWFVAFRTSAMWFTKPRISEIGDLNNVRLTGYLILVVAVLIIFGGIKHLGYEARHTVKSPDTAGISGSQHPRYVSRLGTLFLMVVLS